MIDAYRIAGKLPDDWEGTTVERPFFPRVGDLVRVVKRLEMFVTVKHVGDIGRVEYILDSVYAVSFCGSDPPCPTCRDVLRSGGTSAVCGLFFITELAPAASTRFDARMR